MDKKDILSEIQNIVEQIIQKYKPSRIILFGSAGRGEYDKVNDLDFLIIKQDVPLYGIDRMRELDELIDRNIAADMLVYSADEFEERIKLGDPFIKTILREGQVLYGWSPFSFYAQICFHFHQAAEKYLKSYIIACDLEFKKIHDLPVLLQLCLTLKPELRVLFKKTPHTSLLRHVIHKFMAVPLLPPILYYNLAWKALVFLISVLSAEIKDWKTSTLSHYRRAPLR